MKERRINAKVVLGKCSKTKGIFGMRIEEQRINERQKDWLRTWAFKIDEKKAKREGFDQEKTSGTMNTTKEYPGCPYCGTSAIAQCSCGKIFCWQGETKQTTCPWCGLTGEYDTVNTLTVTGEGL